MTTVHVGPTASGADLQLVPGKNLYNGVRAFAKEYPRPTSLEIDLMNIASGAYAVDLAIVREERIRCVRRIDLTVEVVNARLLDQFAPSLELLLYILSNDNWKVTFVPAAGAPEPERTDADEDGLVLLFSGGLDSFAYASEVAETSSRCVLVSHITHNEVIKSAQESLHNSIARDSMKRVALRVYGRNHQEHAFPGLGKREESQRARSFLFLTMACLVARREGLARIVTMAENGQFAVHIPLNSARVGAFSTHTAHPEFVTKAQVFFRGVLGVTHLTIENPYLYKTKGEVVGQLPRARRTLISQTVSCWRASRVKTVNHCGECVPCLARRIALETHGLALPEYQRDIFSEDVSTVAVGDIGKRNLVDLAEFVSNFAPKTGMSDARLKETYTEFYNEFLDSAKAIAMYRRFACETRTVLAKHPKARWLIQ